MVMYWNQYEPHVHISETSKCVTTIILDTLGLHITAVPCKVVSGTASGSLVIFQTGACLYHNIGLTIACSNAIYMILPAAHIQT